MKKGIYRINPSKIILAKLKFIPSNLYLEINLHFHVVCYILNLFIFDDRI